MRLTTESLAVVNGRGQVLYDAIGGFLRLVQTAAAKLADPVIEKYKTAEMEADFLADYDKALAAVTDALAAIPVLSGLPTFELAAAEAARLAPAEAAVEVPDA